MVVLTFQLLLDCETVIFFFLVFILLFFLCQFLSYFLDVFFASLPSLTQSSHPPPSAPDKGERPFAPDPSFDYSAFLAYAKSTGCFVFDRLCTVRRFSVMETLTVILNCRQEVKRLKVTPAFNSVWKENIVFSAKKIKHQQQQQ